MFNIEIKYYGKPMRYDKESGKVYTYKKDYKITDINKKYKGLYSIKFYLDELSESEL